MRTLILPLVLVLSADSGLLKAGTQPGTLHRVVELNDTDLGDNELCVHAHATKEVPPPVETTLATQERTETGGGELKIPPWAEARVRRIIARGKKKAEVKAIAAVSGDWEIHYSNKVIRHYTIETNGDVIWDDHLIGRITRTDGMLVLEQTRDEKMERLTLGADGRLFVEHWRHTSGFPDGSFLFGIGNRQKSTRRGDP